jgi:hypothetical protein
MKSINVPGFIKPDTAKAVYFYEQEFYVLSNFSAFRVRVFGHNFDTAEHAYHYCKFFESQHAVRILKANSAHEAFKVAQQLKDFVRPDWIYVRERIMRDILIAKVAQHPYVQKKLLETGDRQLIEDSWRDSFWGWGEDRKGENRLGKIWESVRSELQASGARQ